jgi:hypothetical protein
MRKLAIILGLAFIATTGFKEEKKLKVELTVQQWQAILSQLDNSSAPHNEVKVTSGWIVEQLQAQLDTTKKK